MYCLVVFRVELPTQIHMWELFKYIIYFVIFYISFMNCFSTFILKIVSSILYNFYMMYICCHHLGFHPTFQSGILQSVLGNTKQEGNQVGKLRKKPRRWQHWCICMCGNIYHCGCAQFIYAHIIFIPNVFLMVRWRAKVYKNW